jgi:hypothetical protein
MEVFIFTGFTLYFIYKIIELSIPSIKKNTITPIVLFFLLITISLLVKFFSPHHHETSSYEYHSCNRDFLIMSINFLLINLVFLKRGFYLFGRFKNTILSLSIISISSLAELILCPNQLFMHYVQFHYLTQIISFIGFIILLDLAENYLGLL